MAEPTPSNVAPWYLRNINQALALDEAQAMSMFEQDLPATSLLKVMSVSPVM